MEEGVTTEFETILVLVRAGEGYTDEGIGDAYGRRNGELVKRVAGIREDCPTSKFLDRSGIRLSAGWCGALNGSLGTGRRSGW
jgi:hypothetical protein